MEMFDLALIWAFIIGFGIIMYVLMDGFDLGVGILFPFARSEEERDVMMNSVAPVWDGNETWLILGGAGLLTGEVILIHGGLVGGRAQYERLVFVDCHPVGKRQSRG